MPDFHLGWELVDPGPPPLSALLDTVPDSSDSAAQIAWRQRVEADDIAIAGAHAREPVWFPVFPSASSLVIPCFGGTRECWINLLRAVVSAATRGGFQPVRVIDLSRWDIVDDLQRRLQRHPPPWRAVLRTVSDTGSSFDLFQWTTEVELSNLVSDAVRADDGRAGRIDAARFGQLFLSVAQSLDPPRTLARTNEAIRYVLAPGASQQGFCTEELDRLHDLVNQIAKRRTLGDDLDRLQQLLGVLLRYAKTRDAASFGSGADPTLLLFDIASSGGAQYELGRDLLGAFVARAMQGDRRPHSFTVVLGADDVPRDILDSIVAVCTRERRPLILCFERLAGNDRYLGVGGGSTATFMRLPNPDDAEIASRFLGSDYKFILNGQTVTEGQSYQQGTTRGTNWNRSNNSGVSRQYFPYNATHTEGRAYSYGEQLGSSISQGFERSTATTYTRTKERVIEPERFQQIPESALLVIDRGSQQVILTFTDPAIRASSLVSPVAIQR